MRILLATATLALMACSPSETQDSADKIATSSKAIDQRAVAAVESKDEAPRQGDTSQRVHAFGGVIVGSNMGEFGGDVRFTQSDGTSYGIVPNNSAGVFAMPYGVVALTGLEHLGSSRGAVHSISKAVDSPVTAKLMMHLPGAPCDVARDGENITMKIGYWEERSPNDQVRRYACYRLTSDRELSKFECPVPEQQTCNPG